MAVYVYATIDSVGWYQKNIRGVEVRPTSRLSAVIGEAKHLSFDYDTVIVELWPYLTDTAHSKGFLELDGLLTNLRLERKDRRIIVIAGYGEQGVLALVCKKHDALLYYARYWIPEAFRW
jgi:hypothetical protein